MASDGVKLYYYNKFEFSYTETANNIEDTIEIINDVLKNNT